MSKTLRAVSQVSIATYVAYLLTMVRGLVIPRALEPAEYGLWGVFALVLLYTFNVHGGISHAMNREVSAAHGAGDRERAAALRATALTWMTVCAVVAAAALAIGAAVGYTSGVDARLMICLAIVALIVPAQQANVYVLTVFRTEHAFGWIAASQLVSAAASLVVVVLLLPSMGLYAVPVAMLANYLAVVVLLWRRLPPGPRVRWAPADAGMLLRLGVPLLFVTLMQAGVRSVDRFVILRFLNWEAMGYYGLALTFFGLVQFIPEAVSTVLNPQLNEAYGRSKDPADLRRLLWTGSLTLSLVLSPIVALACVTLAYPVRLLLPAYTPAIPVAQILLIGAHFWGTARVTEFFFIAIHRQNLVIWLQGAGLVLNVIASAGLVLAGYGLAGVAVGTALAFAAQSLGAVYLALRAAGDSRRSALGHCAALQWPLAVMLLALVAVRGLMAPTSHDVLDLTLVLDAAERCAIVLVCCAPVLWSLFRRWRQVSA